MRGGELGFFLAEGREKRAALELARVEQLAARKKKWRRGAACCFGEANGDELTVVLRFGEAEREGQQWRRGKQQGGGCWCFIGKNGGRKELGDAACSSNGQPWR